MTTNTTVQQFDTAMFQAALVFYGHPADYPYTFTTSATPCGPQETSEAGQVVWLQANPPVPGFPIKKASNNDIAILQNLTLDAEYSPDPAKFLVLFTEFKDRLVGMTLLDEEQPIEDSGAGCHLVIPITPLDVGAHGGGELLNRAVAAIVHTRFEPVFNELLEKHHLDGPRPELDGKRVKLEAFDISRIISVPGTWRPGNTKPQETAKTVNGFLRCWVAPFVGDNYPQRRENVALAKLVKATCTDLITEGAAVTSSMPGVVPLVEATPATHITQTPQSQVIYSPLRQEEPSSWLREYASRYHDSAGDRSVNFQALVTACWKYYGDPRVVEENAELIDQLTGNKYVKRAASEALRSLQKAVRIPRKSQEEFYADQGYPYDNEQVYYQEHQNEQTTQSPNEISSTNVETVTYDRSAQMEGGESQQHHFTDFGNARRMVGGFGQDLRFVKEWGWLFWDSCRWQMDKTGGIERFAKRTIRTIYTEAGLIGDSDRRKATVDHAKRSESRGKIEAMIEVAKSEPEMVARPENFDANPWVLNCQNGIIDLRSGEPLPHDRTRLITKLAPVEFDSKAQCPIFLRFLQTIMGGNQDLINFLQRAVGYTLTGQTSEQVLFLLYGTGRNGKSTLLEALAHAMGDYAQQSDFNTFLERKGDGPRNDIARLVGARLVSAVEPDAGKNLSESIIKQLTGGDCISARFLNKEYFEFYPSCKLFLAANHKPKIIGQDFGIWRRIQLIPFLVTIPDAEVDKDLSEKLRAELPGILAWAVQGCLDWQREGLNAPKEVTMATDAYKDESDTLRDFMAECTIMGGEVLLADLYMAYTRWSVEIGDYRLGKHKFTDSLIERNLLVRPGKSNKRFVYGVSLNQAVGVSTSTSQWGVASYAAGMNCN